jgi:hypothetical protein
MSKETICIAVELSDKFNVAFPDGFVPEGIIDKTKCRVGITYQAFHEPRHTLVVVPTTAIIEDALLNYPGLNLFAVMDGITPEKIAAYLQSGAKHFKIVSTPDSFGKIITAARKLGKLTWLFEQVFLYMDEYHCYATEAFRERILTPFENDNAWRFKRKAFGSATPFLFSDPRYSEMQRYKLIFREKFGKVTIINDRNPKVTLHYMLTHSDEYFPGKVFIWFNSVTQSGKAILAAGITDVAVFCSDDEKNMINLQEASVYYQHQPRDGEYKKFNFFSKRYDEGWALRDEKTATVILITDIHAPHTIVGIPYQGFQAVGRLEQKPHKIYHITNNYGKETMRTFETIQRNWQYNSAKHVDYYNKHAAACREDGIENDGSMKEVVKHFAEFKNDEAKVYPPKLDQVICGEWILEHYSNSHTIEQAWSDLNYDTEQQTFYIQPILKERKSSEQINKLIVERWEDIKAHREFYTYEVNKVALDKEKVEYALLFEAYQMIGKEGMEKLNYNDKAMKAALIEINNQTAEAKLRIRLPEIFKINESYTKKYIKEQLQRLYMECQLLNPSGKVKTAVATHLEDFGFKLHGCKVEGRNGKSEHGFTILSINYSLKVAA